MVEKYMSSYSQLSTGAIRGKTRILFQFSTVTCTCRYSIKYILFCVVKEHWSLLVLFMIRSFCFSSSNYFKKHGFGNPVVPKEGLFCAALNRQSKEFCRTRVESVSSPEKVRVLHYISFKCGHIVHCTYVVPKILSIAFVYLTTECLSWAYDRCHVPGNVCGF